MSSCEKEGFTKNISLRTVIVYMIADNNLDHFAVEDINEMEQGLKENFDGNLLVFIDRAEGANPSHPVVYKISHDTTANIASKIEMVYKEQNSANPIFFNRVLSDIIEKYPSQSYGLVLWSHGTAWYPKGTELKRFVGETDFKRCQQSPLTKSFGKDGQDELNIQDLKIALPVNFEFIILDACYMGAIEVVYELKDKAQYIISSPSEILSSGFPYDKILSSFFERNINYLEIAKDFYTSNDRLDNAMRTATISVVKTAGLPDLAKQVSIIMNDTSNLEKAQVEEIQQYTINKKNFLFDFDDYVSKIAPKTCYYRGFKSKLNDVVVYKASTPKILEELSITYFSGLSVFIPDISNSSYHDLYKKFDWYKDCNYHCYFDKFCTY